MIKKLIRVFTILTLVVSALVGCSTTSSLNATSLSVSTQTNVEIEVTYSEFTIMTGTSYETKGYIINSSIEGPKIALIGGTHGDETAGYSAALRIKDNLLSGEYYFEGSILVIPKANIVACNNNVRYMSGYADLNRCFPGNATGTTTEKLAYEIVRVITEFGAENMIDLHESRKSHLYDDGNKYYIGETLLASNYTCQFASDDILAYYNDNYVTTYTPEFTMEGNPKKGSYNWYFSNTYPNALVYTIETSRTLPLESRITAQMNLVDTIFKYIWEMLPISE